MKLKRSEWFAHPPVLCCPASTRHSAAGSKQNGFQCEQTAGKISHQLLILPSLILSPVISPAGRFELSSAGGTREDLMRWKGPHIYLCASLPRI